jgi:hypothetical protein
LIVLAIFWMLVGALVYEVLIDHDRLTLNR